MGGLGQNRWDLASAKLRDAEMSPGLRDSQREEGSDLSTCPGI